MSGVKIIYTRPRKTPDLSGVFYSKNQNPIFSILELREIAIFENEFSVNETPSPRT